MVKSIKNTCDWYIFTAIKLSYILLLFSAKEAFEKSLTPIIIDNTNLQCWEMKPYVALVSHWHKHKSHFAIYYLEKNLVITHLSHRTCPNMAICNSCDAVYTTDLCNKIYRCFKLPLCSPAHKKDFRTCYMLYIYSFYFIACPYRTNIDVGSF